MNRHTCNTKTRGLPRVARFLLAVPLLLLGVLAGCRTDTVQRDGNLEAGITPSDIETHIRFLASDALRGRETGTAGEARAATYIADQFARFGLEPAGDNGTFFQVFTVDPSQPGNPHRPDTAASTGRERIARNVVGLITGTEQPDSFIVIGAHYDHLGMGRFGSLMERGAGPAVHNGADDNASGTAGLLELAHYFSQQVPAQSVIFAAFSGEEMGLLGSQHFVEHPPMELGRVEAMINLDMIGRLNENRLMVFGVGSSDRWPALVRAANRGSDTLAIATVPDGTGSSDHTSFYNRRIPVLHYFTDTHADYHRPSDDTEQINFEGEQRVLEHVRRLVERLADPDTEHLAFTEAPVTQNRNVTIEGVTLGVIPDYAFDGPGMRITATRPGGPAEAAGLQSGDIIIGLNGAELEDIYGYMKILNTLKEGQSSTVTVLRDDRELTLEIEL